MASVITNGRIITPNGILDNSVLIYEGGKILGIDTTRSSWETGAEEYIDAGGHYVSPGFIDIHVHGGGGAEASGGTPEQIYQMCSAHAQYGTTSILPTILADRLDRMQQSIYAIRDAAAQCTACNIIGAHLEGPYLSPAQCGAQNPEHLILPRPEDYIPLIESWSGVRIVGAAPELEGCLTLGDYLREHGVLATIAHSDASFEQVEAAVEHGFSDVTHIYSGCSGVRRINAYRIAGVIEAGLYDDRLTVQVIADGKHLPAPLLKLIYKCKGARRIALISDGLCAAATDMEEGTVIHQANGMDMVYDDGVLKMMDRQAFAGSAATMSRLVKNMTALAGVPLTDAVEMASGTPARTVGVDDRKGTLEAGKDADIIIFDEDITVSRVIVMGRQIK